MKTYYFTFKSGGKERKMGFEAINQQAAAEMAAQWGGAEFNGRNFTAYLDRVG